MAVAVSIDLKDDKEYLYHYTKVANYDDWKDDFLRGKIWNPKISHPHKLMLSQQHAIENDQAQFIVCFYPSYENATKFHERDFNYSETRLLRVAKQDLISSGFTQSWDDGFNEGEVYLFWIIDNYAINSEDRSEKGIAIDKVQIQLNDDWLSVREHRKIAIAGLASTTQIQKIKPLSLWEKGLQILFG